jgi:hypothetical protein
LATARPMLTDTRPDLVAIAAMAAGKHVSIE